MLRAACAAVRAAQRVSCARAISSTAHRLAEEGGAPAQGKEEFLSKFSQVAPSTLAAPSFPTDFMPAGPKVEEGAASAAIPDKLTFSFYLPHSTVNQKQQVDLVLLPSTTGDFGVMPGHVPTVAQLRPGVITVHKELDKVIEKYFVAAGFAFVHADSTTDVCAVEAVKIEELDPEAVRAGLTEYTAKLASLQGKADDYEIAAAQIGVEVYSAMSAAIS